MRGSNVVLTVVALLGQAALSSERDAAAPAAPATPSCSPEQQGCWRLSEAGDSVSFRVHSGMTLGDLAIHTRTGVAEARRACGLEGDRLRAGTVCDFAIPHLRPVLHFVTGGETIGELQRHYRVPTKYTIRTFNCLPSDRIRVGQVLLILVSRGERLGAQR